jgi:hypothetical protein
MPRNLKTGIPRVLFLKSQKYCKTLQAGRPPRLNAAKEVLAYCTVIAKFMPV